MSVKLLVKNIISQSILQVANLVLPFITIPYITKIIGPDKFGVINYAAAIVAYFTLLINFSFDMSASRAVAQNPDDQKFLNKIFSEVFYTKMALFIVSVAAFLLLLNYLPQLKNEKQVAVYSFLIVIGWVITPNWLFQGKQHLSKIAMFNLVAKFLFTISIFFFIHNKQHYVWQPLILSISQIVVGLLSLLYAINKYKIKLLPPALANVFGIVKDGKDLFFSLITINLYSNSTIVILGLFLSNTQVGYYSAAYRLIITAVTILSIPLNQALYPFISSSFSINYNTGIKELQRIFPLCLLFSFLYSAAFFVLAPFIIHMFYGLQFNQSIEVFRTMSFVPFLVSVNSFLGINALLNLKRDKQFFKITLISSIAGVIATTCLGYFWGIRGGAYSWLIAEVFNCLLFYLALKKLSVNLYTRQYFSFFYFKMVGIKVCRNISAKISNK